MTSVCIEFDASSFKTRVREGMLVADAKYHVLASWNKNSYDVIHDSYTPYEANLGNLCRFGVPGVNRIELVLV